MFLILVVVLTLFNLLFCHRSRRDPHFYFSAVYFYNAVKVYFIRGIVFSRAFAEGFCQQDTVVGKLFILT